jgi:hypothetical protein
MTPSTDWRQRQGFCAMSGHTQNNSILDRWCIWILMHFISPLLSLYICNCVLYSDKYRHLIRVTMPIICHVR